MSNRTLLEINHDFAHAIMGQDQDFMKLLGRYLNSGDARLNEELERFGVRVITIRHHSSPFYIEKDTDGFPAIYFDKSELQSWGLTNQS